MLRRRIWNEDHGQSNSPAAFATVTVDESISFSLARHVACTWAENAQVLRCSTNEMNPKAMAAMT